MPTLAPPSNDQLLARAGWDVECQSPYEIRHPDGSFATGNAALCVLESLRREASDSPTSAPQSMGHEITPLTQSVLFTETFVVAGGKKLRVRIESDSYEHQSTARISIFSTIDSKWNLIASIPFPRMKTPHKLYNRPPVDRVQLSHFMDDRDELFNRACAILDVPAGE